MRRVKTFPLLLGLLLVVGLTSQSLWGSAVAEAPIDGGFKEAHISSLESKPWRLIGTAVARDPANRIAIVTNARDGNQWFFHERDQIGRVTIKEIQRSQIIIDTGDGEQVVKFGMFLKKSPAADHAAVPQVEQPVEPIRSPRYGLRDRHYVIDHNEVAAAFADPTSGLSLETYSERFLNRQTGVRIASIMPGSIFLDMGLRSGDLLLKVNDRKIEASDDLDFLIQSIQADKNVELTVRRRARTYHIGLLIR